MIAATTKRLFALLRRRASVAAVLAGGLLAHAQAQAIPIGVFSWDDPPACDLFCGPFSVGNFSTDFDLGPLGDSFFDVVVNLETDAGPQALFLGDIAPGESRQSFEDLSLVTVTSAGLAFTFTVPSLPGLVQLLVLDGNVVTALTAPGSLLIDYAVRIIEPVPVAEPSTLLLLAGGVLAAAGRRRAARTRRERA
jgi:hypothetical protein